MSLELVLQDGEAVPIRAECWLIASAPEKTKQPWEWLGKSSLKNWDLEYKAVREIKEHIMKILKLKAGAILAAKGPRWGNLSSVWRTQGCRWTSQKEGLCDKAKEMTMGWLVWEGSQEPTECFSPWAKLAAVPAFYEEAWHDLPYNVAPMSSVLGMRTDATWIVKR